MVRVVLGIALFCVACTAEPHVDSGTYKITRATQQDDGRDLELDPMNTFVVMPSEHGITLYETYYGGLDPLFYPNLDDVPVTDGRYAFEHTDVSTGDCEAGGGRHCIYRYRAATISVPTAGTVHVEECFRAYDGGCSSSTPVCDTSTAALGGCNVPRIVEGELLPAM